MKTSRYLTPRPEHPVFTCTRCGRDYYFSRTCGPCNMRPLPNDPKHDPRMLPLRGGGFMAVKVLPVS